MTRRVRLTVVVLFVVSVTAGAISGWPADHYRHNDFIGFWLGSRKALAPTWIDRVCATEHDTIEGARRRVSA